MHVSRNSWQMHDFCRSLVSGAVALPVTAGRPDYRRIVDDARSKCEGDSVLGVWSAGPKAVNAAVRDHVYRRAFDLKVDFHEMAFEL
jgi:hypothetical protein